MKEKKRVAVLQSSYIPWKGYFDIIHDVDTFIFYDDVQFTYQDWRSRNRIISNGKPVWLTVPTGGNIKRLINEVRLASTDWQRKHWATIRHAYTKSRYFRDYAEALENIYLGHEWASLSELNQHVIRLIARDMLGITTEFRDSVEYGAVGSKQERLLDLLKKAGATHYLSGPSARAYIDPEHFAQAGIALEYKDYSGYPHYPQGSEVFEHAVSVLDLLFNVGSAAPRHIWGWRDDAPAPGTA
ncbi:WbqC family protein [Pseudoxanthomonas mexicana]|uniref:WbqC family protein n=1 Tax=Pseudoxanthomonas mexicana TaxID=128785 RepID=UPI00398B2344